MKVGTKSVLFGAHAFWLHPWFVALAWWKLYGFPKELWLWIAFFVHDLGYWGKPNMDGPEGESHPIWGSNLLYNLEWWLVKRRWKKRMSGKWGNEVLYHSRFWAKQRGMEPSKLCWADKLAGALIPSWLYLFLTKTTGEVYLYMEHPALQADLRQSFPHLSHSFFRRSNTKAWMFAYKEHMRRIVLLNSPWKQRA